MQKRFKILLAVLLVSNLAHASERLIVKYKTSILEQSLLSSGQMTKMAIAREQMQPLAISQVNHLSTLAGYKIQDLHAIGSGAHVVIISEELNSKNLKRIISNIAKDPEIEYVEEDQRVYPTDIPMANPLQWNMEVSSNNGIWFGSDFTAAWTQLAGLNVAPGNGVVVAVVDTGYTPHPNILPNLYPVTTGSDNYGYQFISDCRTAGSCPSDTLSSQAHLEPQLNGLDLGDYLTQSQINTSNGYFTGCNAEPVSTWHGTHVTGIIAATGYDGNTGVVGGAYGAKVVPVRVLGKCGGYDSDIENGMLWAAGKHPTIPNPHPAQVINMSLGSVRNCSSGFQDTINSIIPDTAIVVSAGNDHSDVMAADPASCQNVISVAAVGPLAQLAYYSNYGATISTAPGGSRYQGGDNAKVYSTIWGSAESFNPNSGGTFIQYQGTSMAAPHVSAALADIISYLNNNGNSWNSNLLAQIIQNSGNNNYDNCEIYKSSVGCAISGLLNVESSILYTESYFNQILTPSPNILILNQSATNSKITFTNSGSVGVTLARLGIINSQGLTIGGNCAGLIAPGSSCVMSITLNSYVGPSKIVLFNTESVPVSTVNITLTHYVAPKTTTTSSGGGGCSLVSNGKDFSLLIVMLLMCIGYIYNCYKRKGNK